VVNERPQTSWRPLECSLGFVSRALHILQLIIGKLVGTVSWYFANHASRSEKRWRGISLNCAIRGKQRTTGGGSREFPITSDSLELTYNRGIFGIVHNCTVFEITGHFSCFGNEFREDPPERGADSGQAISDECTDYSQFARKGHQSGTPKGGAFQGRVVDVGEDQQADQAVHGGRAAEHTTCAFLLIVHLL
jgi:hypothetical protein